MIRVDSITVLLLAAGDSTRLWPFSDKHTISFFGKPLISYSLEQMIRYGFKKFVIVSNAKNKSFFEKIAENYSSVTISVVEQKSPKGMAGAVLDAEKSILGAPLLVIGPSDIYEDMLILHFLEKLKKSPEAILSGTYANGYFPGAYLTITNEYITGIVEKPDPDKVPSNIVNFVFDYFSNADQFLTVLKQVKSSSDDIYEQAIQKLISDGVKFTFLPYKGYWGYIKYPWHILNLTSHFLAHTKNRIGKNVSIDPTAVIDKNVILDDGVKVFEHVKISGPSYIGKGTIVGNNVLIRESIIGDNCVIGFSTEVARSYIGNNCMFHNNYIGDSVLDSNVSMGAGVVTANFRLDEQAVATVIQNKKVNTGKTKLGAMIGAYVKIGVNTSLMPGVKIGSRSCIDSGVVVSEDISDNIFYKANAPSYKKVNNRL